eukprot:s3091_g1.t1
MVHALHMFWEPFFGGRLDIWDVWVLQFLVLGTLALQLCLGLLLTWIFARTLHECREMQTALQRERQTYMTTGVVCSEAPKAFGEIIRSDNHQRHRGLKNYIRLLGKELEECKETFKAVQGLLVILRRHTEPLLDQIPRGLDAIKSEVDAFAEQFSRFVDEDEHPYAAHIRGELQSMTARVVGLELECKGQREKIPDSLRRQNRTIEQLLTRVESSMAAADRIAVLECKGQREKIPDSLRRQNRTIEQLLTRVESSMAAADRIAVTMDQDILPMLRYTRDVLHSVDSWKQDVDASLSQIGQRLDRTDARLLSLKGLLDGMTNAQVQPETTEQATQSPTRDTQASETATQDRDRLASVPKPPHGVSPKAEGTYDVSLQFSPTKGWNPFHQETYVVAFRKEGVNWLERPFNPGENLEDMSGDAKKGNRFKATVDGLPIATRISFRVCALSYWGRGPWSREVSVSTMAKPSKDFGCTGPLGPAREKTGSDKKQYVWLQTRNEVHIRIPVGTDVRGKDIKFKALPLRLQVDLAVGGETWELLHGQLAHRINSDDATWYIDESKEEGRYIQITIFKLEALDRWSRVFEGDEHPEIDVRHVQWFVDPLNPGTLGDLDE